MNTNLRLLVDESVGTSMAQAIGSVSAINAKYVREMPLKGASDEHVVAYATKDNRIVVTTDTGMNEKQHAICRHAGIIILASTDDFQHVSIFKSFLASGMRAAAKNAVIYLTEGLVRVLSHSGENRHRLS